MLPKGSKRYAYYSKPVIFNVPRVIFYPSLAATIAATVFLIKELVGGDKLSYTIQADNKVVIVTGASTGIGKEIARDLAWRRATVYMACRDMNRCELARREIMMTAKHDRVYCRQCDLASMKSIRAFVKKFKSEQKRLDILINNAGVMRTPHSKTVDGFETQLGTNHLGHFLLTNLLLDMLKASAPSRIVNVSSVAHKKGKINKEDLNSEKSYDGGAAYAQSKLANVLFTRELAKKLKDTEVTVNAVDPGIVNTEIVRHMSFANSWLAAIFVKPLLWPFIKSPKQGAFTPIYASLSTTLGKVTGKYFCNCTEAEVSEAAKDDATAAWLWAVSEKWTRLNKTDS